MTLRLRLLLVLVGIVAAGLLAADVVTYNQLGSFLDTRADQQLTDATRTVGDALARCAAIESQQGAPGGASFPCAQFVHLPQGTDLPSGTWGELRDQSGGVVYRTFFLANPGAPPRLPANLPGSGTESDATDTRFFSASGTGGSALRYRVLAEPLAGGGTLVVAVPLTEVDQTLHRLLRIEFLVTLAVLVALGSLSWWIVRRGLRPLEDMTETAGAIAAGDLSRRVPDVPGRTEVGRLGEALNAMLGNIEQAFAARTASEERLRRFLADASHELRTPLTSIRGYAEMFDRGARDRPEDLATSMHQIRSEADRMSALVNDLLLLARLDRERPIERQPVDLSDVVADAVGAARVSAGDRPVSYSPNGHVVVVGDAGRLRQVVDNLITNAVRHTPSGTPVEVRVARSNGAAVVEVEDHGQGIDPAEQAHIFEPFHRADRSRARATGGVGLGLAIVAAITRAHGGDVGVRSDGRSGSTFWIRLPAAGNATWPPPPMPAWASAPATRRDA